MKLKYFLLVLFISVITLNVSADGKRIGFRDMKVDNYSSGGIAEEGYGEILSMINKNDTIKMILRKGYMGQYEVRNYTNNGGTLKRVAVNDKNEIWEKINKFNGNNIYCYGADLLVCNGETYVVATGYTNNGLTILLNKWTSKGLELIASYPLKMKRFPSKIRVIELGEYYHVVLSTAEGIFTIPMKKVNNTLQFNNINNNEVAVTKTWLPKGKMLELPYSFSIQDNYDWDVMVYSDGDKKRLVYGYFNCDDKTCKLFVSRDIQGDGLSNLFEEFGQHYNTYTYKSNYYSRNIKLIQGSIKGGTYTTDYAPPIQLFFSSDMCPKGLPGELFNVEFPIKKHEEGRAIEYVTSDLRNTDVPYGGFDVVPVTVMETDHADKSYDLCRFDLLLMESNPDHFGSKMFWCRIKSDMLRIKNQSSSISVNDTELRNMMRLVGVIEGVPPYGVNPDKWSEAGGGSATFTYTTSSTKDNTASRNINIDVMSGVTVKGGDLYSFESMVGYALKQSESNTTTTIESYTMNHSNNGKIKNNKGIAIFLCPAFERLDGTLYDPDNNKEYTTTFNPQFIYRGSNYTEVEFDLNQSPFSVADPEYVESWTRRLLNYNNEMNSKYELFSPVPFTVNANTNEIHERTIKNKITQSTSHTFKNAMEAKIGFFKIKENASLEWKDECSTTVSNSFKVSFSPSKSSSWLNKAGNNYIQDFNYTMYGITDYVGNPITARYYEAMKNCKVKVLGNEIPLLIEGEKPFLILWRVNNIYMDNSPRKGIATGIETIEKAISTASVVNDQLVISSALANSVAYVYTIQGKLLKEISVPASGTVSSSLEDGLYVVLIQNSDGTTQAVKIRK